MNEPHDPEDLAARYVTQKVAAILAATRRKAGAQVPARSGLTYRVVARSAAPRSATPPRPTRAKSSAVRMDQLRREKADLLHRYLN